MSREKKKENISKRAILSIIFFVSLGVLIFSGYKIIRYKLESDETNAEITALEGIAEITEIDDSTSTNDEISSACQISENPDCALYWKYLNTPLIDVNLAALKAENSDTVGWLQVLGTNVNYPFVQTADNRYYLYHSFNHSYNSGGWVFLDYRNNKSLTDKNSIIYAHGRLDNTMFGSLRKLLTSDWISNPENFLLRTKTENSSELWQVFSIYIIPTTSDYLQTSFYNDATAEAFFKTLKSRSTYNFNTSVSGSDRILTLSTCYDDSRRLVIHAKLLKSRES